MTRFMWDSTTLNDIPANAQMAATYINGRFAVPVNQFVSRFPHVPRVFIDINGTDPWAQVRDWENGDKSGSLEQWVKDCKLHNEWPTIYCNRATIPEVRRLTGSQILGKDYWLWIATLDGTYAITYVGAPTGIVAVQAWGETQTHIHADRSIVFADWWLPSKNYLPPPPPPPPPATISGIVVVPSLATMRVSSSDGGVTWHKA